jgi:hypothetical protein
MKQIGIYHHVGLGDSIECNAIVRQYANLYDKVFVFAKYIYTDTIKYMYRDLKNIEIVSIANSNPQERMDVDLFFKKNLYVEKIIIGHEDYSKFYEYYNQKGYSCSEAFYDLAKIDYKNKYNNFFVKRNNDEEDRVFKKLNPKNEKYIFVHDDPSRGFEIKINSSYKIIKNDISENIFYMLKILENAEEIHCMSSSVLCLIDCLSEKIQFKKLFLHSSVRSVFAGPNSISNQWKKI